MTARTAPVVQQRAGPRPRWRGPARAAGSAGGGRSGRRTCRPCSPASASAGRGRGGQHGRDARAGGDQGRLHLGAIPPVPTPRCAGAADVRRRPGRPGRAPRATGVRAGTRAGRRRTARRRRTAGAASARDQVRDQRGEPVVVAEPDLVGGDRVVLVDDRHARRARAAGRRCAGRCGSGARRMTSSAVSSTWPAVRPCRANSAV